MLLAITLYLLAFWLAIALVLLWLFGLLTVLWNGEVWSWLTAKRKFYGRKKPAPCAPARRFRAAPPRRSGGRPKPPWVIDTVLHLYTEGGKSYREVRNEFNRLYAGDGMTVCLNTVYAWVQKYCSEAEIVRAQTRNRLPGFSPANLRWCLDGTGKADALGVQHFILGMVDHGTRLNLLLVQMEIANAQTILAQISQTVKKFGKPRIIRTDNAPVFRSAAFQQGLAAQHISHEFTVPGKPWMNGRIERFFLTLKEKLNQIVPEDGTALDSLLGEFGFWYNAVRPHQHLHGFTPMEVWTGINPYQVKPKKVFRFCGWDGMLKGFYMLR